MNTINIEILKKISQAFYVDFKDIVCGIANRDENIYNKFRMAMEELLRQINNSYHYIDDGERFYNRIVNNYNFQKKMINEYKCDSKLMNCIIRIQKLGNDVTHNKYKVFDEKDVKDTFYRILLLARKILQYERNINTLNFNATIISNEFDKLLKNNNYNSNQNMSKEDFQKEIIKLDNELKTSFPDFYNNESMEKTKDFVTKYKELLSITLNYILLSNYNYNSLEDLKIGNYSSLYKYYNNMDNLLGYDNHSDIVATINDSSYILRNIINAFFQINILDWLFDLESINQTIFDEDSNNQIAEAIDRVIQENSSSNDINGAVYYVESQRQFISKNKKIYYVVNLKKAINDASKSNTVYSISKLPNNYALEISLKTESIELLGNKTPIFVITNYKTAIRPCELKHLIYAINGKIINGINKKSSFYNILMNYIQENNCSLYDVLSANDKIFNEFLSYFDVVNSNACDEFISATKKAREIIKEDTFDSGANLLKYFTNNLVNSVLRDQLYYNKNKLNSKPIKNLFFLSGSYRFDRNPYSFDLLKHKVNMNNLYHIFPKKEYEEDIIAKRIKNEMIEKETLFIDLSKYDLSIIEKIKLYNLSLKNNYDQAGEIGIIDNYAYIIDEVKRMKNIYNLLLFKSQNNESGYYNDLLTKTINSLNLDSNIKKNILYKSFENSKLCMILGEAGSGKTELLCNYYANIFKTKKILFLSNTHTCKNNMMRRVNEKCDYKINFEFKTVKSFNSSIKENYDIVIIDECKSISNRDIEEVLEKVECNYLIMAGDIGQIDAIELGNWFDITTKLLKQDCIFNLYQENYRTNEKNLRDVWKKVRNREKDTLEYLTKNNYIEKISQDIFKPKSDSEIILCLNYNGTYGITSINSYFQNQNPNSAFVNNLDIYKVGNPIVFNENANNKYGGYIYNNLQGEIRDIKEDNDYLIFTIHVDLFIPSTENFVKESNKTENWSNIIIKFKKYTDKPDEENEDEYLSPFTVTYALSIHKAQGLEYDSVKIIITPESEEKINNEIFYTAITRAKKFLKIYTTNDSQSQKLDVLSEINEKVDIRLLPKLFDNLKKNRL